MTPTTTPPQNEIDVRRQRARRTALGFGLAAVGVYVVFLLMGVVGQ